MSSPSREWSWEPRVTIHPSHLEMTPLRIPSPAPDSPEYSCQGSEESSFSSDEGCPTCKLGEGDTLHVSGRGVVPCALEKGVTSHGLVGVPPLYPSAARLEGRSPRKLRIKLKSKSLGESSRSHPETTTVCVVDAASTLGPLPGGGEDPIGGRESAVPLGGSACGSSSSITPASYTKERFKYKMIDGHRVKLDPNGNILPHELRFASPQPKICSLPYPDDEFICCESNALALAQAMANVSLVDQRVYCHERKGRMAEWMGRDLNWNLVQASEEGIEAITELTRPSTKPRYNMAFQHFASYLSEVPADKKWDGLPWPHDDISVTDQNIPYYIADEPAPPIVMDVEEEGEPGEVNIADS
ncbi:hypothetical protein Dimus_029644 [Dionaea muscipula]